MKPIFAIIAALSILALSAYSYAGCSENAYSSGCASCKFDNATGKFDRACTSAKQNEGKACLAASYPIAMSNYQKGNCSMVDECISQLNSCTATVSSGNEKADCAEGSMATCYATADICFKQAAGKCSDIQSPCAAPTGMVIIGGGAAILAALSGRKGARPATC